MAEPWLIHFFACNREMQPFSLFFFVIRCGAGRGCDFGPGSGSKFNCAARVGSGRVGRSRVRAGFGLQFWARADLYSGPPLRREELQELMLHQYRCWRLQINIPLLVQACYLYRKCTRFQIHCYELHRWKAQHDKNNIAGLMMPLHAFTSCLYLICCV